MFPSKIRPINLPQYEHGKLAGTLADCWGNSQFALPSIDRAGFVHGVAFHDWNYRMLDNDPILAQTVPRRLELFQIGIDFRFDDPTADIVVLNHLRRLMGWWGIDEVKPLITQVDQRIADRLPETGRTLLDFASADTITNFCDLIAFDFGFEEAVEREIPVYVAEGYTEILRYQLRPNGRITIAPWPFSQPSISGFVIGYERDDYPEKLIPHMLRYDIRPS